MRATTLFLALMILSGCDVAERLPLRGGTAVAYAQDVRLDTAGVVARRIFAERSIDREVDVLEVLPDGRAGIVIDWETGDLLLHDLTTGASRNLTQNPEPYKPGGA